jgi:hypothetical protein
MRVLTITTHGDYKSGTGPTAVVELPEGSNKDEVYLLWHNKNNDRIDTLSGLYDAMAAGEVIDSWVIREILTLESLKP